MRGNNISTVGERFLILACLAIKNDEKISIFFCTTKRNFYSEDSSRFHACLELNWFSPGPISFQNN